MVATGMALVLAAALLALLATPPADAASRYKTVTRTITYANPIVIDSSSNFDPANPYPSQFFVSGFKRGQITDVNIRLVGYSHGWPDDVGALLVGPTGKRVLAMADTGSSFDTPVSGVHIVLDDEAAAPLPDNAQITTGAYWPTRGTIVGPGDAPAPASFPSPAPAGPYASKLAAFDGTNPNGPWRLFVLDDYSSEGGQIAGGWELTIKARVPR